MSLLAWLGQLITRHEETPEVEVIMRDYEWQDKAFCSYCKRFTIHVFIEWMPDRVVTQECAACHLETEVAREAGPETVDH